ncbi:MAG: hypothetical protein ACK5ZR_00450 [Gemmatimonadaceae bacterium]
MTPPDADPWEPIRARLAEGDVLSSSAMADALQRHGGQGIPDDIRTLFGERLRRAPTPGRKGRPKHTAEQERLREMWVLSLYNRVEQIRARGIKKADAIKQYAQEAEMKEGSVEELLANEAPRVRRKHPNMAFNAASWRTFAANAAPPFDWSTIEHTRWRKPAPDQKPE